MTHGTTSAYARGCRCAECKEAKAAAQREYNSGVRVDRDLLSDLLNEMFPFGLTDDCPVRQHARSA